MIAKYQNENKKNLLLEIVNFFFISNALPISLDIEISQEKQKKKKKKTGQKANLIQFESNKKRSFFIRTEYKKEKYIYLKKRRNKAQQ